LPEIVQEIGAYAGLASVVGLAVLSALYFSQARDVKRLREWAGRAPERAGGQAPAAPGRVPAQPAVPGAPPAAARPAAAPTAAAGARPATAAAPATGAAAATPAPRPAQPAPTPSGVSSGAGTAVPATAAASAGTAAPAKPADAGQNAASQTADRKAAPDAPSPGTPAPKPTPGNAGAPKDGAAKASTPAAQPASRPAASPPVPPPKRVGSPTAAGRPGGPTRPTPQPTTVLPPTGKEPWYRSLLSNPLYAVLAVAGVLIVGGAAAFGITQLASDGGVDSSDSQSAGAGNDDQTQANGGGGGADNGKDKPRGGGSVRPGSVTVAVLNGTTVPGLAATLADQVTSTGFRAGTVANFTNNQQLAESVVQYSSGHEREAAAVSRRLGIDQREAATPNSRELAGDATVIVIAGGDKAP
jgi:hypothetical protein